MLPRWLLQDARFRSRVANRHFLPDVLWGQYTLFLFCRIHDDLFDRHADNRALLFLADILLVESERTFAKHFRSGPFWPLFRTLLDTSLHAVLKVAAFQPRDNDAQNESLRLYAEVSSVFKVAAAAVCVKSGRMKDFEAVSEFSDAVAVANQIVDDVMDIEEDLPRGRFNFAAHRLRIDTGQQRTGEVGRALARAVLLEDGLGMLAADVRTNLDRAGSAIEPLGIREATAYIERSRRTLQSFTKALHTARVRHLFGPVLAPKTDTSDCQPAGGRASSSSRLRDRFL